MAGDTRALKAALGSAGAEVDAFGRKTAAASATVGRSGKAHAAAAAEATKHGNALTHVGNGFTKAGKSATAFGHSMSTISLGIAAVAGESVKLASQFQASMERVHTQAGASQHEVDKMGKALIALGPKLGTGPDQLAQSLYHVESAGFRGAKALDMVTAAAKGAQIGGAGMEETTQAMIAAMASNIKGVHGAADAMAQLNTIVGTGDMKMSQLAKAMATGILPSAASAGLSLKDVGASLATITDNATPADEAATRLRMTFALMTAPTLKAKNALASIGMGGMTLAKDMRKPDGMLVAVQDLHKHLDSTFGQGHKLDASQQKAALASFADQLKGAGVHGKELKKDVDAFSTSLKVNGDAAIRSNQVLHDAFGGGKSSGAILTLMMETQRLTDKYHGYGTELQRTKKFNEAWTATTKTQQFQFHQLGATAQAAGIKMGSSLGPVLIPILKTAVKDVEGLVNAFEKLPKGAQHTIEAIAGTLAVAAPLAIAVGGISKGIGVIGKVGGKAAGLFPGVGGTVARGSTPANPLYVIAEGGIGGVRGPGGGFVPVGGGSYAGPQAGGRAGSMTYGPGFRYGAPMSQLGPAAPSRLANFGRGFGMWGLPMLAMGGGAAIGGGGGRAMSSAGMGAMAGSMFGPVGTLSGGVLGLLHGFKADKSILDFVTAKPKLEGDLKKVVEDLQRKFHVKIPVEFATKHADQLKHLDAQVRQTTQSINANFAFMRSGSASSLQQLNMAVRQNWTSIAKIMQVNSQLGTHDAITNYTTAGNSLKKLLHDGVITHRQATTEMASINRSLSASMGTSWAAIAKEMKTNTAKGARDAKANLGQFVPAIKAMMKNGLITTQQGTKLINDAFRQELSLYGITGRAATNYLQARKHGGLTGGHARGGFIGSPGEKGQDTVRMGIPEGWAVINGPQLAAMGFASGGVVPAVVGRGEYLAPPEEQGFFDSRAASAGYGGLDGLFAAVNTPHYYAKGGKASGGGGRIQAMIAEANRIERAHLNYRWGGGHGGGFWDGKSGLDCSGAVSDVLHAGGMLGAPMVAADFMKWGLPGPGAVTIHAGPGHVMMDLLGHGFGTSHANPGGGAGWLPFTSAGGSVPVTRHAPVTGSGTFTGAASGSSIKAPTIGGPNSALKGVVTAATKAETRAANDILAKAALSQGNAGGGNAQLGGLGGGKGALGRSQLVAIINQALDIQHIGHNRAGWRSMELRQIARESSGRIDPAPPNDINTRQGNPSRGLAQVTGSTFRSYAAPGHNTNIIDPLSNILASIRYIIARYGGGNADHGLSVMQARGGGAYARGGFIGRRFSGGGKATHTDGRIKSPPHINVPTFGRSAFPLEAELGAIAATLSAIQNKSDMASKAATKFLTGLQTRLTALQTFRGAIAGVTSSLHDMATTAAAAWATQRNTAIDTALSGATGPIAARMKARADAHTDTSNAQALKDAQFRVAHSGGKAHLDALQQLQDAQDAIADTADQRQIDKLTDSATAQHTAVDAQTKDYETGLDKQLDALVSNLGKRKLSYAAFVKDVNAILGPLGSPYAGSSDDQAAFSPSKPLHVAVSVGVTGETLVKHKKHRTKKHHAAGGVSYGEYATVGELGPEDVYLPPGATVSQASQSRARRTSGGGIINQHFYGPISSPSDAERMAHKLAFRLAHS